MNDNQHQDGTLEPEEMINGSPARLVTLQEPIKRAGETIDKVHVLLPRSGALRGLNMADMLNANADAIMQVLPRITHPSIFKHEAQNLHPADLLQCGMAVVSFFVPKAALQ